MKYIRLDEFDNTYDFCVVFPDIMNHSDMVISLGSSLDNVVSAGFVTITKSEMGNPVFKAYGESVSLNKKCQEDDDRYLNYMIYKSFDKEDY